MGSSMNTPISKLLSSVTQLHLIVFKYEHTYKKAAFRREENTAIVGLFSSVNTNINYQGYMYCQSRVYSKGWPCRVTVNKNKQAHTICRSVSNVALKFHQGELCYFKKEFYGLNTSYLWEQDRNVLKSFFTTFKNRHITNFICYQSNL